MAAAAIPVPQTIKTGHSKTRTGMRRMATSMEGGAGGNSSDGIGCALGSWVESLLAQHVLQHGLVERQIRHQPFQLAFSSSRCFSLRISATLIPANCFFHR
jgi:hypothetical protein